MSGVADCPITSYGKDCLQHLVPPGIHIRSHKNDLLDWDRVTGIFTARLV